VKKGFGLLKIPSMSIKPQSKINETDILSIDITPSLLVPVLNR
jgi:hypothetical protein